MLLTENGLDLAPFEPVFASMLGSEKGEAGCKVVAIAAALGRTRVQLRDWLYCLAQTPGTHVRKRLIDPTGRNPQVFVDAVEDAVDDDDGPKGFPVTRMTSATVAPEVVAMLASAEQLARDNNCRNITEAVVTFALLQAADASLRYALTIWAKEEGLNGVQKHLRGQFEQQAPEKDLFTPEGRLDPGAFDTSGRKLLQRVREDAASVGAKKISTRHVLYTLLGNEGGLLPLALSIRGVDVKRELHSVLSRELARPGAKRNDALELTRDTLFDTVVQLLRDSRAGARERGAAAIGEYDVGRSFVFKHSPELVRLFGASKPLDLAGLREYVQATRPDEEDAGAKPVERFSIKEIEKNIRERIRGQDAAVARVLPWIKRLRFGLPRAGRPAAVFLFLGPTGAGKTQLAKELAKYVFGDEDMMVFLEMGQFKSKESMSMFIGAPPGYVGYGDGKLTNGLKEKPESVVLFDEIEKADTQVFDTLLRFADEGVISDPAGPVRDGRKCIIVMTTNAGQAWLRDYLKTCPEKRNDVEDLSAQLFDAAMQEMQSKGFRPEFLGRLDERITFLPFTLETCRAILDDVLNRELENVRKLKDVCVEVPEDVRAVLAQHVFDRAMDEGARGAPRAVNEYIITPLIDRIAEVDAEAGEVPPSRLIASVVGLTNVVLEVMG